VSLGTDGESLGADRVSKSFSLWGGRGRQGKKREGGKGFRHDKGTADGDVRVRIDGDCFIGGADGRQVCLVEFPNKQVSIDVG
jgi:hypothetical protein